MKHLYIIKEFYSYAECVRASHLSGSILELVAYQKKKEAHYSVYIANGIKKLHQKTLLCFYLLSRNKFEDKKYHKCYPIHKHASKI